MWPRPGQVKALMAVKALHQAYRHLQSLGPGAKPSAGITGEPHARERTTLGSLPRQKHRGIVVPQMALLPVSPMHEYGKIMLQPPFWEQQFRPAPT